MGCQPSATNWTIASESGQLQLTVVADSIEVPYGMCFLPNGSLLVSNRKNGQLLQIDPDSGVKNILKGVPASFNRGDGGALDLLPHPDYKENGWIYYSYSSGDSLNNTMVIERAKLKMDSLVLRQKIFTVRPSFSNSNHYGTRMAIDNGYLFFTMGDRYVLTDSAQSLSNHLGKTMRIFDDGRIPTDNPFVTDANAQPEIWSYGHRNPQGLKFHPKTKELWQHEHGPKGGDELNLIKKGTNYGWPLVCFGVHYDGTAVGEGMTEGEGLEQPIYHYTPSIAPSSMEFYFGDKFPEWKGNLFIGALGLQHLNRLVIEKNKVVHEERLLLELGKRIRVVRQGPDGYLYLGVDGGMILKLMPG